MINDNVPCEIDSDEFPPFHAFIATPELYYCYLQFLYQYDVEGGLLPDESTIVLDGQNKLHVPIDEDTLYLEDGELKAKQTLDTPTAIRSLDPRTVIGGSGFDRTIDTTAISGGGGQPTDITTPDPRVSITGTGYSRGIDTRGIVNTDNPTALTSLDDRTIIGGSGFSRTIDTRSIADTPTDITSLDSRTKIGGTGFNRTIDTNDITGDPTEIESLDPRTVIGGAGFSKTIDTSDIVNTDTPTSLTSLDSRTKVTGTGFDLDIDTRDIVNTDTPTALTSLDERTKITGSGFNLEIDTSDITGGGSTYTSSDLNIDNTNETINFKDPALTTEQILVKDDILLSGYLEMLGQLLTTMQTDIDSKVKTVDVTTNTPEIVTITKTENNKNISFELDVGTIPTKDLTELVSNDNVKTITFEDASKISTAYIISFVGSAVGQLEFYDSGSISLVNDGGNNLLMTNNLANPDITTAEFTWVQATKTLTFLTSAIVNTNDLIDVGVGEYTIKQNMGLQDVNIASADNTAVITKSMANDMIDFDLAIPDQSKPTNLSSDDARTTIGGSGFDLTIDTSGIVDTDTPTSLTSLDPRTPVTGSGFNLEIDTSNIADYGLFLSDVELSDDILQYEAIAVEDLHAKNLNMKLSTGSMVYDSEGRLGYITGWDNTEETIARVYTIVTEMPTGFIKTLELGSGGGTVSPDGDGNAVIPYADAGNDDGIVKGESDTVTINNGLVNVKLPLPTPTEATANYVLAINPAGTGYELVPAGEEGKEVNIESSNESINVIKTSTATTIGFDLQVKYEDPNITTDIWVDSVNGDDDNDGLTLATAYQTFARAIHYVEHERTSTNFMTIHLHSDINENQTYDFTEDRGLTLFDIAIVGDNPDYLPILTCQYVIRLINSRYVTFEYIHFQHPTSNTWSYACILNANNTDKIKIQHCTLNVLASAGAMNAQDLVSFDSCTGLLYDNNYLFNNPTTNCAIFRVTWNGIITIQAEPNNTRNGLSYLCHNQYGIFASPQNIGGGIQPTYPRNSIGAYFA